MIYKKIKTNNKVVIKILGLNIFTLEITGNHKYKNFFYGFITRGRMMNGYDEFKINKLLGITIYKTVRDKDYVKTYLFGVLIKQIDIKQYLYDSIVKYAPDYDDIYILNSNIGEAFCFVFYLSKILLAKSNGRKIIFGVTNKNHLSLFNIFASHMPVVYIHKVRYAYHKFCLEAKGKRIFMFPTEYFLQVENNAKNNPDAHYFKELLTLNNIKAGDIKVQDISVSGNTQKSVLAKAKQAGLNINNFIFVSPHASSCKLLPERFWAGLQQKLKALGFDIFVNTSEGLTLEEAFALAKMSKAIIGLRSGIFDILAQTKVPMHIVYADFRQRAVFGALPSQNVLSGFSLKKLPNVDINNITEYDNASYKPEELIKRIVENLLAVLDIERKFNSKIDELKRKIEKMSVQMHKITPQANIDMLEIHITEHCNLNCQACTHFSTLAEPEFVSLEYFEKDTKRMAELTLGQINKIHILGGEPLLHPDCVKFLEIIRKYFPDSIIRLITNGVLLPQQDEKFYLSLAKNNIVIEPTKYPIKIDWDKIEENCKKHNVKFEFYTNTAKQTKTTYILPLDLEGKQNPKTSFMNCSHANNCVQLVNGKLYTCCFPCYIRHFNKYFNKNLITNGNDCIDIYKAKDINEILTFLAKPIPFCRYCKVTARRYGLEWKTSKKEIQEWL